MAKVSIINNDHDSGSVIVDGVPLAIDLTGLVPDYAHALHYDTGAMRGTLEYRDTRPPVELIDDMTLIAPALTRYAQLLHASNAQIANEQAQNLARLRSRDYAKQLIDMAAGNARARFISPGIAVDAEYRLSLDQAKEFRARSYATPIPASVRAHAEAFECDAQAAADAIVATAAMWFAAIEQIRAQRLVGKARVDQAPDAADFAAIAQPYINALDAIQP